MLTRTYTKEEEILRRIFPTRATDGDIQKIIELRTRLGADPTAAEKLAALYLLLSKRTGKPFTK